MHEVAAVYALVDAAVRSLVRHQPCRVDAIRVQRGTAFQEEALLQGFKAISLGTPLEGARLEIEVVDHMIDCPCGIERPILAEEVVGHVWVCANCGHLEEIDEQDDLSLVDLTITPLDVPAVDVPGVGGR